MPAGIRAIGAIPDHEAEFDTNARQWAVELTHDERRTVSPADLLDA